ncbi:NACHT domain-containing protein [Sinosporangium siamense]|uniref:NACHT domain-containing protein n=1 Tax=Sinosporangium siamense TaxID=1367973 RepID=A0A919VG61_9ACTN|nr:NACHT domain-containing protein [Sinosporangium siamense]GII96784.1 NACHT domain-containing protein [Sinosporangium siamense]
MSSAYWRRNRKAREALLGFLLLAASTAFLIWVLSQQSRGASTNVVGFVAVVSAVGGAVTLGNGLLQFLSWWRGRTAPAPAPTSADIGTAKDILAGLVIEQWRDETALRSLCDPEPMPLPWRSTERRELVDHPEIIARGSVAFSGLSVHIADMARNFRALRCRRLVILGDPGTGKTTLAVQLVLELLRTRQPEEPVPVLLSAGRWDDHLYPHLRDWLAASLAADYPALRAESLGSDIPETLVARGEVLPVIDGLDELPGSARVDMLTTLNRSMRENDQLIITCRTEQFAKAVEEIGDVLTATAVIEPQPMAPAAAAEYLRACLPPVPHPAWPRVLEALREGTTPALSEVTSTSLGLWLVRATYIAPRVDPAPLLELGRGSAGELHDHLCDRLIPALVSARPPADNQPFRPRHAWGPEQVGLWLTYLSHQLRLSEEDLRDMAWWHLARHTSSRTVRVWSGIAIAIGAGVAFWLLTESPHAGAAIGLVSALVVLIVIRSWFGEPPGHADFHFRGRLPQLLGVLRDGLIVGALGAVVGALGMIVGLYVAKGIGDGSGALEAAKQVGLLSGIGFVVVLSLIRWVEHPTTTTTARSPRSTWRADRTLTVIRIFSGVLVGAVGGAIVLPKVGLKAAILGGLVGLLLGLVLGRHHAWLAYKLTVLRLATKGRVPLRAMDFLDDAHRLGLLRTEGPYYQFRHIELQHHLAHGRQETTGEEAQQPSQGR